MNEKPTFRDCSVIQSVSADDRTALDGRVKRIGRRFRNILGFAESACLPLDPTSDTTPSTSGSRPDHKDRSLEADRQGDPMNSSQNGPTGHSITCPAHRNYRSDKREPSPPKSATRIPHRSHSSGIHTAASSSLSEIACFTTCPV